jgi:hypothetical protein
MFGLLPCGPEVGVISILLAPARITARGLQMAARIGADPDVFIGRRYREFRDTRQRARVANRLAVDTEIPEPGRSTFACVKPQAANPAALIADVNETSRHGWHARRLQGAGRPRCRLRRAANERVARCLVRVRSRCDAPGRVVRSAACHFQPGPAPCSRASWRPSCGSGRGSSS